MKQFLFLLTCISFLLITACKEQKDPSQKVTVKRNVPVQTPVAPPTTPSAAQGIQQPNTPPPPRPVATTAVQHYICPNNCAGSGGANQGNCPVCNTAYTHNAAFHQNQQSPNNAAAQQSSQLFGAPPAVGAGGAAATNASGAYHYICSAGCAGGAGAAGNCATCGNALTHNQAFHN